MRREDTSAELACTPAQPCGQPSHFCLDELAGERAAGGADLLNRSVVNMKRIAELMKLHTGNDPSIPSEKVISECYDLLHQLANPTGRLPKAVGDRFPDYPTEYLPTAMRKQLDARGSLHPAGIGAAMLACASASCMATRLMVDDSREVIPTLWIPSIGYAGVAKTPAAEIAFKPYRDREDRAIEAYTQAMLDWKNLEKKERAQQPRPTNDSRLMSDTTAEALVRRLQGSIEGAAFVPDELSSLLLGFGSYKKGDGQSADKAKLLELWSGRPWTYERVGSGDEPVFIHIRQPIVPIFGTIQPDFVRLLGDVGSGMQARWLPHVVGERVGEEIGYSHELWVSTIDRLLHCLHSRRTWNLRSGSAARAEHIEAERRWNSERQSVEQTPASTAFLTKGGEHSLRVALILAEVEAATEALERGGLVQAGEIPRWAVRAGIQLVDYCAAVWRALGSTEAGLSMSYAERAVAEKDDRLNAWLHGRENKSATFYEIQRAKVAGCRTKAEVEALVARHRAIYGEDAVVPHRKNGYLVRAC